MNSKPIVLLKTHLPFASNFKEQGHEYQNRRCGNDKGGGSAPFEGPLSTGRAVGVARASDGLHHLTRFLQESLEAAAASR